MHASPARNAWRGRVPAILAFLSGLAVTIALYLHVRSWKQQRAQYDFTMRAYGEAVVLQRALERTLEAFRTLRTTGALIGETVPVDDLELISRDQFIASVKNRLSAVQGLHAVAWVPRIPDSERLRYEVSRRQAGTPDFQIWQADDSGASAKVGRRPEYFPVHHLEYYDDSTGQVGLDLNQDPIHRQALRRAGITLEPTVVVGVDQDRPGDTSLTRMEILQPVFRTGPRPHLDAREREAVGFILGLLNLDRLVRDALINLDDPGIDVCMFEGTLESGRLFYNPAGSSSPWLQGHDARSGGLNWRTHFDVAGQQWTLLFLPSRLYFLQGTLWYPWQVLGVGFFVSLLLGAHLWNLGNRRVEVERLVVERTRELSTANRDLELEVVERKRAEDELRKISRAVQQSANLVIITDADQIIEYVNPKFTEVTGYEFWDAVGQSPKILATDRTPPEEHRRMKEALAAGREWQGEFHNRRKDGKIFRAAATISPIRNEQGEITNFLSVQVDITRQKQLEEQFLHAQKMEVIGRLVGGVAHDFNNILTTILGFGQLFLRKLGSEDWMRPGVEETVRAAERAAQLTKQLLLFARKKDERTLVRVTIRINSVVESMEKLIRRTLGEDVELLTVLEESAGSVEADQSQIEQVLMNLAVNARDAMPLGGKLVVRTRPVRLDQDYCRGRLDLSPGDFVLVSVADTGCGMSDEIMEHIFEPFFTTKGVGKGTGLGLSTVYGIVRQHGGDIEVFSEIDVGTEFKIYLPRSTKVAEAKMEQEPKEPPHGTETILVVEDDESVRHVTCMVLRELGYQVIEARHGKEALDICRQADGQIDLIFSDVVMPHMGGPELANALRAMNLHYRVMYASGFSDNPLLAEQKLQDGTRVIEKPFTREELGEVVREVLDAETPAAT